MRLFLCFIKYWEFQKFSKHLEINQVGIFLNISKYYRPDLDAHEYMPRLNIIPNCLPQMK